MIDEQIANELNLQLQRIFCLPISRSTFRDVQNVAMVLSKGEKDKANQILEVLFTGVIKPDIVSSGAEKLMRTIVERFTIPSRMSKEVFEKGDFMGSVNSEMLTQKDKSIAINRIRKVDGEEMQFATDPRASLYMVHHFLSRLEEFHNHEGTKKEVESFSKEISDLITRLEKLK